MTTIKKHLSKSIAYLVIAIAITTIFWGCKGKNEKFIDEGIVEYTAAVVDKSSIAASIAPSKMTIKFKNNRSLLEMSTGMGLFSTAFVSNPDDRTLTQMVKLLRKKYWLKEGSEEIKKDNATLILSRNRI